MSNGARAFTSLVMFVIGFVIVYKFFEIHEIYACAMMGWLLGGTIWGWFISEKWFSPRKSTGRDSDEVFAIIALMIRVFVSIIVGSFVMAMEFVKLLIGLVKLIVTRSRAKKARDSIQAASVENEQAESGGNSQN